MLAQLLAASHIINVMPPHCVDLTIHLTGLDTEDLLREWRWRVPEDYTPIQMTKFGDWFLVDSQKHVHMLDLIEGSLQEIAPSIPAYDEMKNGTDKQSEWFLDSLVFRCVEAGVLLSPSQCCGWRVHPMLGGELTLDNVQVFSLRAYQSLMGQIFRQYQNLKPGDPIPPLQIKSA